MSEYNYNLNGYPQSEDDYNPYRNSQRKKKSGFGKGLLVGILSTLLVCFAGIAILVHVSSRATVSSGAGKSIGGSSSGTNSAGSLSAGMEDSYLAEALDKIQEIQEHIDEDYLFEYDEQDVIDNICYGMLYGLGDPYSYYYNEEEFASLQESYAGEYYGIGVLVSQDMTTGEIMILRVYDGPAKEAGIQKGDILYRVEDTIAIGGDLNTVVALIKGEEGTTVNIEIYRPSTEEYIPMDVERRQIEVESVEYYMLEDQIGYIVLDQFEGKAASQIKTAIAELENQGMEGLILDLRDNPGGDLNVLLNIADIFLPTGVVITMEDVNGNTMPYSTKKQDFTKPLVVLVNENSASASEALSGAIKDYEVGTLVGTQTFGKGIVQSIYTLDDGKTAMKLTTAHYYTPGGTCIHGTGITPNVIVELDDSGEDNQLAEGIEVLRGKMD